MSSPDREWRRVSAALDLEQLRRDQLNADWQAQVDTLRGDLTAGYSELLRANQEHAQRVEAERHAWLSQHIDGYAPPTQQPAPRQPQDASVNPASGTTGAVRTTAPNPHAVELELAEELADMDMATYAARRAEFGIRDNTSLGRRFG